MMNLVVSWSGLRILLVSLNYWHVSVAEFIVLHCSSVAIEYAWAKRSNSDFKLLILAGLVAMSDSVLVVPEIAIWIMKPHICILLSHSSCSRQTSFNLRLSSLVVWEFHSAILALLAFLQLVFWHFRYRQFSVYLKYAFVIHRTRNSHDALY